MAGCISSAHGRLPKCLDAYSRPATVPGTPDALYPVMLSRVSLPAASRYMSCDAASGARSRKSMKVVRPSASRTSMNPPPPMLPALECVTASANPTATAASMAFPPDSRIFRPACVAWVSRETTMPWRARTGCAAQTGRAAAIRSRMTIRRILNVFYYAGERRLFRRGILAKGAHPFPLHLTRRPGSSLQNNIHAEIAFDNVNPGLIIQSAPVNPLLIG